MRDRTPARTVVAAVLGTALALLGGSLAHADEPPWEPDDATMESTETFPSPDDGRCSDGTSWEWSNGQHGVGLILVPCESETAAAATAQAQVFGDVTHPDQQVLGVEHVVWSEANGLALRLWVQDAQIVALRVGGDTQQEAFDASGELAREVAAALPGTPVAPAVDGYAVQGLLIGAPLAVWLLLVLPARALVRLRRPRYDAGSADPRWTDVSVPVRIVRRRRAWRRTGRWLSGLGLALVIIGGVGNLASGSTVDGVARLAVGVLLVAGGAVLLRRNRPHAVEQAGRLPSTTGPLAWLGTALSVLAHAAVIATLLLVGAAIVVSAIIPAEGGDLSQTGALVAGGVPVLSVVVVMLGILVRDAQWLVLGGTVAVLAALAGLGALGRRLRAVSLREVLARDPRAPILYLRSFDEDRLTLPSTLLRRGLVDVLNIVRRRRFEEAIVVQLQRAGPVVAIAPPGSRLPRLGAARASFGHDEWQQEVTQLARRAGAVVLSGTPDSVRDGFGWELDLVAERLDHRRVLVVVGPWRGQLARRWEAFRAYVAGLPFFAGLASEPLPDGLLVAGRSDRWDWHAWGATERTDISYAVAIDHALHAMAEEIAAADAEPDAVDPLLADLPE